MEAVDDRADHGEVRHIALGLSGDKVLNVVYTWKVGKRYSYHQREEGKST